METEGRRPETGIIVFETDKKEENRSATHVGRVWHL